MERTFKSKIDYWFHLLLWCVLAIIFYFFWSRRIGGAVLSLIIGVFLLESLLKTEYIISDDGYITVKSGFMPNYKLCIADIKEVRFVKSNRIAYALSWDRLQLITPYVNRMISPVSPDEFVKVLRKYNHHIEVTDDRQ